MEAYTNNTITSLLPSLILLTSTTTTTNLLNDNNYNNSSTNNNDTNGVLQSDERTFRSLQVTGFFTFFIGFPTNLIIISLVLCKRRLRNPTNFFVCSLAVADIMVLLWLLIWVLGIQNILSTIQVKRFITPSIDIFLGVASMVNVACVSADRGIAVVYPLRYEFIVSKRRAVCAIIIAWTYAVSLLIAAFLRIQYHNAKYYKVILYAGFTSYFVPVSIILVSYSVIFVVIVRKLKSIRELERVVSSVAGGANCGVNQGCDDLATRIRKKRRRRKLLRELKVTANILFIVVPFTSGWSYFIGTHIYEHAYKVTIMNEAHNIAMIVIPWLLSGLNPIIYLLLNRSLRKAMVESVKRICRDSAYTMEDSFFTSFSRRASNAFRRASAGIEEGGLLYVSRYLQRRRDSRSSVSTPSRSSLDVTARDLSLNGHVLQDVEESDKEERSSSIV